METTDYRCHFGPDLPMRADRVTTRVFARSYFRAWRNALLSDSDIKRLVAGEIAGYCDGRSGPPAFLRHSEQYLPSPWIEAVATFQVWPTGTRVPYGADNDPAYNSVPRT